jgi:hypothetical protein
MLSILAVKSTSFILILTIPHVLFAPLHRSASFTLLAYSRRFFLYYLGKGADHTVEERRAANRPSTLEISGRRKRRRFTIVYYAHINLALNMGKRYIRDHVSHYTRRVMVVK